MESVCCQTVKQFANLVWVQQLRHGEILELYIEYNFVSNGIISITVCGS